MSTLPSISIIVPNFNAGKTLGGTLRSLVEQAYPGLEILVIDGGSTDESVSVIKEFAGHIAYWESEKDRGQSHAINKGFSRCKGEVVNWLCSDDYLTPGALMKVGEHFAGNPGCDVFAGASRVEYAHEPRLDHICGSSASKLEKLPWHPVLPQPSVFYRRSLLTRTPVLDESLHYTMDIELWNFFYQKKARFEFTDEILSVFPMSRENKSAAGGIKIARELAAIYERYAGERIPLTFWHRHLKLPIERFRKRHPGRLARVASMPLYGAVILALSPFYGYKRVHAMNWMPYI